MAFIEIYAIEMSAWTRYKVLISKLEFIFTLHFGLYALLFDRLNFKLVFFFIY